MSEETEQYLLIISLPQQSYLSYMPSIGRVAKLLPSRTSVQEILRIVRAQMEPGAKYRVKYFGSELRETDRRPVCALARNGAIRIHVVADFETT
jgi:hypothetical protein